MESVWSLSKLSTESVGSRRELVVNCVHTADVDATQLDSCVASAVCIGHKGQQIRLRVIFRPNTLDFIPTLSQGCAYPIG